MEIIFDYDHPPGSPVEGRHLIETTPGLYPQFVVPVLGAVAVDVIQLIRALHTGLIPLAGTGWDVISKHPAYQGMTRLEVLVAEIIRLNDAPARGVLGV